ncbi:hypothetical protein BEL04_00965 [Mucilaginibacter sp. PPCGB 2223]|uniref:hypothetical protein n=1 Tax=Mucilaginibacter sp. PPCGB 2223 TaxID=1886027 RepID=UPI0008271EEB|nr:hypothetical protein [Mucilaginibacter sp. PPCGB 2223]OCX52930.1 hypothetical protein BEL04_00965 [Mucilaginibacter sp. PPCGB 2223]
MLTKHANLKIYDDVSGSGHEISVTPLFLQNRDEPWGPNEIFDLAEPARLTAGIWQTRPEPLALGKIIINDKREWRFEGECELNENEISEIAAFVLNGN